MTLILNRNTANGALAVLLFILWPLGGALYAVFNMVKNRCFAFYAVLFSVFMGLYGYTFNPTPNEGETDMSRIYNIFDMLAEVDFRNSLPFFILNGDLSYLYYWTVAHLGFNAQIVGMFAAMLLYGSFLFLIQKVLAFCGAQSRRDLFVMGILMCFLTTHPVFFSGIRTAMALGLFLFGVGYYLSGKKTLSTLLMLAAVCIHFFFAVVVFFFFLSKWLSSKAVKRICWILVIGTVFYYPLAKLAVSIFMNLGAIGVIIAGKIEGYGLNWEAEDGIVLIGSRKWLIQTVLLVGTVFLVRFGKGVRDILKSDAVLKKTDTLTVLMIAFSIFSIYNLVVISRMVNILNILCILWLVLVKLRTDNSNISRGITYLYYFICFLGVYIFASECLVIIGYTDFFKDTGELLSGNLFSILNIKAEY